MKKGDKEELLQLKKVLKESLHDKIKKTLEQTSTSKKPKELKEQMEAIKSLLSDLNQDKEVVKRIAEAVTAHNECQWLIEEEIAKKEADALEELKKKRREEEEEARKNKGKEKMEDSPIPSPEPLPFLELLPVRMDTKEEKKLKQEQEEEDCQEEIATLNSLVDHYKREDLEVDAIRREYKAKYLEASTKLTQQEELIVKLTHEGIEKLQDKEVEHLKEGMHHIRKEHKELNEKYQ